MERLLAPPSTPKGVHAPAFNRLLSLVSVFALVAGLMAVTATPAAAAEPDASERLAAASKLLNRNARQADEQSRTLVNTSYDHLLAFAAAGQPNNATPVGRAWYLFDALEHRVALSESNPAQSPVKISNVPLAATTSISDITQVIHISAVYGKNPANFADRNFIALLDTFQFEGADPHWYRSTATGSARTTTAIQARAVLGLAAAGADANAADAAAALRAKQLANGAWGSSYTATATQFEATVLAMIALTAEGSPASLAAVADAADYLEGVQQTDGSFTGGTTPVLIAQAANALRGAGRTESAGKAAAFVSALQTIDGENVDGFFKGGVAANATARGQIEAGTAAANMFSTVATNTLRGIYAWAAPIGTLSVNEPAGERPAVEGNDTFHAGACVGNEGVTVVVDYGFATPEGEDPVVVSCALGTQNNSWNALANTGAVINSVPGQGGALCMINQVPAQGYPYCWTGGGYWSLWTGEIGEAWKFSSVGAGMRVPPRGAVDGWRFVPLGGTSVPPRTGPSFVAGQDSKAPGIEFTSGANGEVDGGQKLPFAWTLDDMSATVECRLDEGDWANCSGLTSHTLFDVANGEHTFSVRATDEWDNRKTISRTFTVVTDVTAPVIEFTKTPGVLTNVNTAAFAMTVDDTDAAVECRLDAGEWGACTTRTTQNYTGLAEGEHIFSYRATDLADNTSTASFEWTIAADAPPVVLITTGPSGLSGAKFNSNTTSVTVNFSVAESGTIASRECKLDEGAWAPCYSNTQARWSGLSLTQGVHTVSVRATNGDGLTSPLAEYEWTVDSIAPVVTMTSAPAATTTDRNPSITWNVTELNPLAVQQCAIDGGAYKACSSPLELSKLGLGAHSLSVQTRDVALNWGTTVTTQWTVERAPAEFSNLNVTNVKTSTADISATVEAGNVDSQVRFEYGPVGGSTLLTDAIAVDAGAEKTITTELNGLESDTHYRMRVVSTDESGTEDVSGWEAFTTEPAPANITSLATTAVGKTTATVEAVLTAGDREQEVYIEYGRVGSSLLRTSSVSASPSLNASSHEFELSDLRADTEYRFRAVTSGATGTVESDWETFTTLALANASVSLDVAGDPVTGKDLTITWDVQNAQSLTASGDWSGSKNPAGGSEVIRFDEPGVKQFTLTAEGEAGTTSVTAVRVVVRPKARFTVRTGASMVMSGKKLTVKSSGLAPNEAYRILVSGIEVKTGTASSAGTVSASITVPTGLSQAKRYVHVRSDQDNRTGTRLVQVLTAKKLKLSLAKKSLKRNKKQKVTVRGLAAGEPVTVKVNGKKIKTVRANAKGVAKLTFKVGRSTGKKTVRVTGLDGSRKAARSYKVRK